jgi:hypothetical protein
MAAQKHQTNINQRIVINYIATTPNVYDSNWGESILALAF